MKEAEPAPLFVAQLMSKGLEPVMAVPADDAWKDGRAPLEAGGPGACPKSELEAAGVLKAGKLGMAAAEAPRADGALRAPAPKPKGAAAPPLPGKLKRPPDGCGSFSAAEARVLLLLLLPQPNATGAGAVLAAPPALKGSRAAWLVAAEGSCFEEPLRTGGTQLSGAADAAAVAELSAQSCHVSLPPQTIMGLQHPVNHSAPVMGHLVTDAS